MFRSDCPCHQCPSDPPVVVSTSCPSCLTGSQIPVHCDDAPYPCGNAGSKLLTKSAPTGYFSVYDHDAGVTDVHFTGDTLYWKMNFPTGGDGSYVRIRYMLKDTARPSLSFIGTVLICARNLCANKLPPLGFRCDPCSGTLVPESPEVLIPQNPEIEIS